MTKKALSQIKQAEEEAARIISEATEQARIIVSDAEKRAADLKNKTEEGTAKELAVSLGAMRKKADELLEKSISEARAEADGMLEAAELKKLSAVKKLVWEIVES